MIRRTLFLLCGSVFLIVAVRPARAQEPLPQANVRNLRVSVRPDGLWVSYRVDGAFSPAVLEKLAGSTAVRFIHRVRLVHRRMFGTRTLAERTIEMTAQYDNLTRQYSLTRAVDGAEQERTTTESEEEMQRFMTVVGEFRVAGPEAWAGQKKATVQIRAEYEDTWLLFLFPWSYSAREERDIPLSP